MAQLSPLLRHIHKLAAQRGGQQQTDRQLLDSFGALRDEAAFATLVARHGPMVLRVCRRVLNHEQDAEDAFQATFLVLARNSGSIRKHDALANWLYGVAYRTAMKAKRSAIRRRNHEARLRQLTPKTVASPTWDELQAVLDEEIQRLPDRHRAAFVLCILEGKSGPQAAAELGVKEGTVWSRLTRARQLLQHRLTRRGIKLSAMLAALSVAASAGKAAVPAQLASATLRSGLLVAAGGTAAGQIPSHIAALAAGVTRAMFLTRTKIATVVMLVAGLLTAGAGALANRGLPEYSASTPPATANKEGAKPQAQRATPAPSVKDKENDTVDVSGCVLGPNDKPFHGAKLYLWTNTAQRLADLPVRAMTDAGGRFRFSATRAELQREAKVIATAKGAGPDWMEFTSSKKGDVTLRLAKDDVPIAARILDLEGRPVVGATIEVAGVDQGKDGDLKAWFKHKARYAYFQQKHLSGKALEGLASVTTGKDGRFGLSGFGRDRVVYLRIKGPTIENGFIYVVTRMTDVPGERIFFGGMFPAKFDYVAGPSKPIVGTVRDKATGKPLADVTVASVHYNKSFTTTDAQGRYRLEGVGKHKDYAVAAAAIPYFNSTKFNIPDTPGTEPLTVDFELERGIPVKGRLIDKATGKPVSGRVSYVCDPDNPRLKDYTELNKSQFLVNDKEGAAGPDGTFTVLAIPGRGTLCITADDTARFIRAEIGKEVNLGNVIPEQYHALIPVNVSEKDQKSMTRDIALEPGRTLAGLVVGPDGKPLAGAQIAGRSPIFEMFSDQMLETASLTVGGLDQRTRRALVVIHAEKKLAKVQRFRGDDEGLITIRLEPLGALSGRIVDTGGKPRAGLMVAAMMSFPRDDYTHLPVGLLFNYPSWSKLTNGEATTDGDGKFRVEGLVPGLKYLINVKDGEQIIAEYTREVSSLEPGKAKDLGDLKAKPAPRQAKE